MEEEIIQEPAEEEDGGGSGGSVTVDVDITPIVHEQMITNEKLEELTVHLTDADAALKEQLFSMYLFVMLLALLEVRKVFKGIISKVRVK